MATKNTNVQPSFSLSPRGDLANQTIEYLDNFFRENPDDTLRVTTTITGKAFRDYKHKRRVSLATFQGTPTRRRSVLSEE